MNTAALIEVRDFISAHPRNVDMNCYSYETIRDGTIACIAGWLCMFNGVEVYLGLAQQLLDVTYGDVMRLCYKSCWPPEFLTRLEASAGQAYGEVVVDRINYFIETGR